VDIFANHRDDDVSSGGGLDGQGPTHAGASDEAPQKLRVLTVGVAHKLQHDVVGAASLMHGSA
jgi:hypothetical protein